VFRNHSLFVFKTFLNPRIKVYRADCPFNQSIEGGFAKVFEQQPNGKGAKDATLKYFKLKLSVQGNITCLDKCSWVCPSQESIAYKQKLII